MGTKRRGWGAAALSFWGAGPAKGLGAGSCAERETAAPRVRAERPSFDFEPACGYCTSTTQGVLSSNVPAPKPTFW